jgi:DNA (cytosine-5)-methyltransferase 1
VNELALFAGAGGGILGGKLLGWRTVCAVEIDPYCAGILVARQNERLLPAFPVWDNVTTFDGKPWRGIVDVVSGGFPCQDISCAGTRKGIDGERSGLWKEFARIIGEVRPRFAFVENSPMLVVRGGDRVIGDLAALGYDCRWGVVSAADAGAPHRRERIWIVGELPNAELLRRNSGLRQPEGQQSGGGWQARSEFASHDEEMADAMHAERRTDEPSGRYREQRNATGRKEGPSESGERGEDVADADDERSEHRQSNPGNPHPAKRHLSCGCGEDLEHADTERWDGRTGNQSESDGWRESENPGWWESEPDVGRVANGVAARVDKLRALGNGQVPAVAALAWRILSR